LLLDIIFIQWFGLIGPAIATVVSLLLTLMYSMFYCEKRIKKLLTAEGES
jgi:O-antigen/teichoic acid export membrane protein